MNDLAILATQLETPLTSLAVVYFRITGLIMLLPGLGERLIPMRIRLAMSFAIAVILAPVLPVDQIPDTIDAALILSEITVGAAFGATLRYLAHILLIAGTIAAQATSLAQLFGAPSADPSSAIGTFLHMAGIAVLMASGFHVAVIEMLGQSWKIFPVGFILPGSDVSEWGVRRVGDAFSLALTLSMPFVVISILYNVTLGVINKAMPQLMVALVGAPAITGIALLTLALTAALILSVWRDHVASVLIDPFS